MEQFDLYDSSMNKLPHKMNRGEANNPGEFHLVVHIWIRNKKGQYLIQQRNKKEDQIPYQWAVTGGAVLAGETSIEGAIRETQEEIGVSLLPHQFQLIKRDFMTHSQANYITDLYLVTEELLLNDCKIDTVEVKDLAYKSMHEIKQMIEEGTFWDYERLLERKGYFDLLEKS